MGLFDSFNPLSLAAPLTNAIMGGQTNIAAAQQAGMQRSWETEMSNTAHQREVKDFLAAGLNPILSAQTSGSSTPSGAMPSFTAPQVTLPDFMANNVSLKQIELAKNRLMLDTINSKHQNDKTDADALNSQLDAILKRLGKGAEYLGTDAAQGVKGKAIGILDKVKEQATKSVSPSGIFSGAASF